MEYRLTAEFLTKCLEARTGLDRERAIAATAAFLDLSLAMQLLPLSRLEAMERDAHILYLAGEGLPRVTIALRLGMARSMVFEALRRHQRARREALRRVGLDSPTRPGRQRPEPGTAGALNQPHGRQHGPNL